MRPALALLLLCSCAPAVERPVTGRRDAILGGTAAATESQVFLLDLRFDTGAAAICSAVLVSPRVLLTAAHCVDPAFHSASSVTVRAMNKPDVTNLMMSDTTLVTQLSRHPSWNPNDTMSDFDLAALLLQSAPVGVTPASMATALTSPVGQMVNVVGYGRLTEPDGASSGTRRAATMAITANTTATLTIGDGTNKGLCLGDSGGPSFLGAQVVGIHSRAIGSGCGAGVDIRVDTYRAFIDAFITSNDAALCTADGRCALGCPGGDPDCPTCLADGTCNASCGNTDPDCRCLADGVCDSSCAADPDCRCRADGTCDSTCSNDPDCRCRADGTCDSTCSSDPDCVDAGIDAGAGTCLTDGRCDVSCGLTDADCLDDGAICTDAALCAGGLCVSDSRGFSFCTRACTNDSSCVNATTCQADVCRPPRDALTGAMGGCTTAPGLTLLLLGALLRRRRQPSNNTGLNCAASHDANT